MFIQSVIAVSAIAIHSLVAWVLVEVFVNNAHQLKRRAYMFWHYVSVIAAFAIVYSFYFHYFFVFSIFTVTMIAMGFVLLLEFVVFNFLYSGERWFLNYVDWLFPMFLAMTTIYYVGFLAS